MSNKSGDGSNPIVDTAIAPMTNGAIVAAPRMMAAGAISPRVWIAHASNLGAREAAAISGSVQVAALRNIPNMCKVYGKTVGNQVNEMLRFI